MPAARGRLCSAGRETDLPGTWPGSAAFCRRALLPGKATLKLDLQRHAEERPDQHDDCKHSGTSKRRRHRHGADDVGSDEELKAEENCLPYALAILAVVLAGRLSGSETTERDDARNHNAEHDDCHTECVDALANSLDCFLEVDSR